ncbi:hypothetical protein TNCV_4711811 [Trichonephila clavipes]|nr:hypothetical protein TNCV_4711811 [Trichonephila clavipes]
MVNQVSNIDAVVDAIGFIIQPFPIHIQWEKDREATHPVLVGLCSNIGEDVNVCKCMVPLRHGSTLQSRSAASPLVRLVEGEERWEALTTPRVFSLKPG